MKCGIYETIPIGVVIAVVALVSTIGFDQINQVKADSFNVDNEIKAELSKTTELAYTIPSIQEDVREIKSDVKDIKEYLLYNQNLKP